MSAVAPPTGAAPTAPGLRRQIANYISLTKPRIIELLLVTTVPVMF
ncbi:MAG TPA: protoheme IX farnesyltransferase, partial [Phycicoccus sp.]|nr:protoheme IX farnesyltransferase [Phycicoccus sp.]